MDVNLTSLFNWKGLLASAAIGALLAGGGTWRVMQWRADAAKVAPLKAQIVYQDRVIYRDREQAALADTAGQKAAEAQAKIQVVYRDRIKEVPIHVTPAADARCIVPLGFVRSHDAAALDDPGVSIAPGQPDDAPSGVELSAVGQTVVSNYGSCRSTAQQLTDLQHWVTAAKALSDKPLRLAQPAD